MEMKLAKMGRPIALSLCMSAWLLAGNAHAANSHLYSAVGCQETFPDSDAVLNRINGVLESAEGVWVTCPIVTDVSAAQITVTVFYEAGLYAPPTYVGKPVFFDCSLQGYDPATQRGNTTGKSVQANVRNNRNIGGSLTMSMKASQFNLLDCYLTATKHPLSFRIVGYQVDES